jgi:tetratricopeptide (TPR) repeat protein
MGLSVALFAAGAVGLSSLLREEPPAVVAPDTSRSLVGSPVISGGSLQQLIGQLQDRLRVVPEDWRSFASLGLAYVQQARITADPSYYPKAEGSLQRSLELQPAENFESLMGLGVLALARHDFPAALSYGEEARDLNPYNGPVYGVIGDALLEMGRYDQAFQAFQDMVDRRPDLSSYARVSYARELQGDVPGAIEAMELALDSAAGAPEDAAWVSYQLAELYFNSGRLDQAERYYADGTRLAPQFVPPYAGLAKVAWARGQTGKAIRGYRFVVERYPAVEFVIALGDLYALTGQAELAQQQFDLVGVQEALFRANGVNTDLEFALFHADHGTDLTEALRRARAEYAKRQSVHVADALAWTLYANGRYREAMGYSEEALSLGYRNASFHFHAGMIALSLGHKDVARDHLEQALDVNPHFSIPFAQVADRALAELEAGP